MKKSAENGNKADGIFRLIEALPTAIVESYGLGVNNYIVKPVNYERFTATVQKLGLYWLLHNQPPKMDLLKCHNLSIS